jgi:hypothetical protein
MVKINLAPTYRGIWISTEKDILERNFWKYALFSIWKKEDRTAKILEKDGNELVEANAEILLDNGLQIKFIKRYNLRRGDLLKGNISYSGRGNGNAWENLLINAIKNNNGRKEIQM